MSKKKYTKLAVEKIQNGFIVGVPEGYSGLQDQEFAATFEDAVLNLAQRMGEDAFASTVKQAQAMASAITEVASIAIAPKLLAIESKMNPGVENIFEE